MGSKSIETLIVENDGWKKQRKPDEVVTYSSLSTLEVYNGNTEFVLISHRKPRISRIQADRNNFYDSGENTTHPRFTDSLIHSRDSKTGNEKDRSTLFCTRSLHDVHDYDLSDVYCNSYERLRMFHSNSIAPPSLHFTQTHLFHLGQEFIHINVSSRTGPSRERQFVQKSA